MPGSLIITAVCLLTDHRVLDPEKPKTAIYDCKLLLETDANEVDHVANTIVHYYVEHDPPELKRCHLVTGKLMTIRADTEVGEGYKVDKYDIEIGEIDTFVVQVSPSSHPYLLRCTN